MTFRVRSEIQDTIPDSTTLALASARRLASSIISRWEAGEQSDAIAALEQHPELRRFRSVAMDLIYEDYCRQREAGKAVDPEAFAAKFPRWHTDIRRQIEVHSFFSAYGDLSDAVAPWPRAGDCFAGFALLEELGRGALARVFLAKETAVGDRQVAVKVSLRGGGEAHVLGRLEHPNIVPVYSAAEEAATGLSAICMPFRGRATLSDLLDRLFVSGRPPAKAQDVATAIRDLVAPDGSTPEGTRTVGAPRIKTVRTRGLYVDAVLSMAVQLVDALAYTHARGILHRDLKPSNILLSDDGIPMLLDFNLSADSRGQPGRIGGTLPYMAPEQVRQVTTVIMEDSVAEPSQGDATVDERSDLFSLGVVLYELLTGVQPFAEVGGGPFSAEAAAALLSLQQRGATNASKVNPQVDKRLADLVAACMSFDPEARPNTAETLLGELRSLRSVGQRAWRWMRWNPVRSMLFVFVLVGAAAAASAAYSSLPSSSEAAWRSGITAFRSKHYHVAAAEFQRVADEIPDSGWARCALARCRQLEGDDAAAREQFDRAYALLGQPWLLAGSGYSSAELGQFSRAADRYERAMGEGFDDVRMKFNLAFVYGASKSYDRAIAVISRAIAELNTAERPDSWLLASAYRVRTKLVFNRAVSTGSAIPPAALADAKEAIAASGRAKHSAYFLTAAVVALRMADGSDAIRAEIVGYLRSARRLGASTESIRSDPDFQSFLGSATIERIVAEPQHPSQAPPPAKVFDPLGEGFSLPYDLPDL